MGLLTDAERQFADTVSRLIYCNPFLPERIEAERVALGPEFTEADSVWSVRAAATAERPNVARLRERVERLAEGVRARLAGGMKASAKELELYEDLVLYALYYRCHGPFSEALALDAAGSGDAASRKAAAGYGRFAADARRFLCIPGVRFPAGPGPGREPEHLFACFFQIRRAFHHVFSAIVGGSPAAARLRAAVWHSVFTHDLRRYRRVLFRRMGEMTTLVTGPSGTGKELVARAIGLSRYIPFERSASPASSAGPDGETGRFAEDFRESFHALNISALSPTLVESELFGHRRGAFTGAVADRVGWLESCRPLGTVFLDEIGELDERIQVKLLRLLETRTFQRLGDTKSLRFAGKIVAATNRDLAAEMGCGRFRPDFYYRLCSDLIVTPSLRERLAECPEELDRLVGFAARRLVDDEAESAALAEEAIGFIRKRLGPDYHWPGNVRELEQCIRNVMIRREYRPAGRSAEPSGERTALADAVLAGRLTAEELLRRYCTLVHAQCGGCLEKTAERLGLDRRTVKSRVDPSMLERLRSEG
jgi:DNA-binding NtrC family response regulator